MTDANKMNGSMDLLAKAMRQVFTEAVEDAVDPLRTEMKATPAESRDDMNGMAQRVQDHLPKQA